MYFIRLIIPVVFVALIIPSIVYAQSNVSDVHQKTTTPPNARFEIIQSELAAKWTFRLDRYIGKVYQLVKTNNNKNKWQEMPIEDLPAITKPRTPRFILFTSGIAARHTFLMDTITGKSWVLSAVEVPINDSETVTLNVWQAFEG